MVHPLSSSLVPETVIQLLFSYPQKPLVFRIPTDSALASQLVQWRQHTNNYSVTYTAADIDEASIDSSVF